ncbi:MAG: stage II sporulation protein D [Bacilli bacterium]
MKNNKYYIISAFLILLLFPLTIFSYNKNKKISILPSEPEHTKEVNLLDKNEIKKLKLEEYIVGVVACEMPASFNEEALKAQSISARTYALYKMDGSREYDLVSTKDDQCYITQEEMKNKWKNGYTKYYNKVLEAVNSTKDKIMIYQGKPIKAFYFSTSNGYTEDVKNVFGEEIEYLVSVESPNEEQTTHFNDNKTFTIKDFLSKLSIDATLIKKIDILGYSKTNRVNEIIVNDKKFKGTKFRQLLNLNSTDFKITYDKNNIYINTVGYGHGVGMSQYGANAMAIKGKTYEEILKHYYKNIIIKNV